MPLERREPGTGRDPHVPAQLLAQILKAELNVDVSGAAIVEMFKKRWRTLSDIAHMIHDANRDQELVANMNKDPEYVAHPRV